MIMAVDELANESRQLFWDDCLGHALQERKLGM